MSGETTVVDLAARFEFRMLLECPVIVLVLWIKPNDINSCKILKLITVIHTCDAQYTVEINWITLSTTANLIYCTDLKCWKGTIVTVYVG